jgi:hypothetical protein
VEREGGREKCLRRVQSLTRVQSLRRVPKPQKGSMGGGAGESRVNPIRERPLKKPERTLNPKP